MFGLESKDEDNAPASGVVLFESLAAANKARQEDWKLGGNPTIPIAFRTIELIGEVGEALNIVKKLMREANGWRGSRATTDELGEELADCLIVIDLLWSELGFAKEESGFLDDLVNEKNWWAKTSESLSLLLSVQAGGFSQYVLTPSAAWQSPRTSLLMMIKIVNYLALGYGIDINRAVAEKFNATSEKYGFKQRMIAP